MSPDSSVVSSPPPSANPAPEPATDARDRLHALTSALQKHRDPHLLRQYLLLRAALR
ncbi:MAG: hypothetical protein QM754_03260 [Tepidisphaeraceae bacterium]